MGQGKDEPPGGSTVTDTEAGSLRSNVAAPADGQPAPLLAPGTVIGRRYFVQRFIARGGMGEVYAVEDRELHQQVALKTITPARANEPDARERFRREVQLSRRVTHPNVCRLFDVGFHEDGTLGTVIFCTMELLEGETLAERLARDGRMRVDEALPIVEQIAAALDAAHTAGVVHCDFKPHNVLLVKRGESSPPRVVVTDFGLARALDSARPALPVEERMFGTPAYMAPEQVRGQEVTARSDLYALGVTLFQMATGQLPFVGSSRRETASMRLTHPPAPPRQLVPDLDVRWERALLPCLERDPARRPARAEDAARQLRAPRRPRPRTLAVGAALLLLLASTAVTWVAARRRHAATPSSTGRRSLAVAGWAASTTQPDQAWIGTALGVLVGDALAAGDELRLAPPEDLTRARRELGLRPGAALDRAALAKLRADLDVDDTVSGSYEVRGDRLEASAHVVDARGREVAAASDSAPLSDLRALATRLAEKLRQRLGVPPASADGLRHLDVSLPSSPEAIRLYAEAEACTVVFDYGCAVDKLKEVVRREPDLAIARRALSQAYFAVSNKPAAVAEAKAAFERAGSLPREQRILTEAVYRTRAGEYDAGIKLYQALATFYPDQPQYALSAIEFTCFAGRCADSLTQLDQLRRSPDAPRDDARVDLLEARLAIRAADYPRADRLARRAADEARRHGAQLVLADALYSQCSAAIYLGGDIKAPTAACDEALEIYRRVGDRLRVAGVYNSKGHLAKTYGRLDDSRVAYQHAADLYKEIGSATGISTALGNLAMIARRQGHADEASRILGEVIALDRREHLTLDEAIDLSNLGRLLHDMGDRSGAQARELESLAISEKLGSMRKSAPYTLGDLGILAFEGGRLDEAQSYYQRSAKLFDEAKDALGQTDALVAMASLAVERERFAEAHALLERARTLLHAPSDELSADADVTAAALALAERHLDEAERVARRAEEEIHRAKSEMEPMVLTALAEVLIEAGKVDEARATVAQAKKMNAPGADARVALALVDARVVAAGDAAAGAHALDEVRADAARIGLVGRELTARLYAARARQATQPAAARSELQAVRRDARAHGMTRLAHLTTASR